MIDSLESLVSWEQTLCRWVRRFPSNEGIKESYPRRNRYFTTISSSSVRTVADRHRLAAYITSSTDELSRGMNIDDLQRPWNPKIAGFSEFLQFQAATRISRVNCAEITKTTCIWNFQHKTYILTVYDSTLSVQVICTGASNLGSQFVTHNCCALYSDSRGGTTLDWCCRASHEQQLN